MSRREDDSGSKVGVCHHPEEAEMQRSVRRECRVSAGDTGAVMNGLSLKDFSDKYVAQVVLGGMQIVWTVDCQDALVKMSKEKDKLSALEKILEKVEIPITMGIQLTPSVEGGEDSDSDSDSE